MGGNCCTNDRPKRESVPSQISKIGPAWQKSQDMVLTRGLNYPQAYQKIWKELETHLGNAWLQKWQADS